MKLHNYLSEDMILMKLNSQERDGVLREMVKFLKEKNKISKEKDLYEKLIQRENLGTTAIGSGVAIPHCKLKGIKNPLVMLAISEKGVDFESLDGKPSQLFFLVVSPPDNPSLNLQILATIAQLVRKSSFLIDKILKAKNRSSILDIISEEEEKGNEQ